MLTDGAGSMAICRPSHVDQGSTCCIEESNLSNIQRQHFLWPTKLAHWQSQNTLIIKFKDINWSTCLNTFQVFFEHSKTDQLGDKSKYACHLYSNPLVPCICPVMSLTLYFSSCFNCTVTINGYMFPNNVYWHNMRRRWTSLVTHYNILAVTAFVKGLFCICHQCQVVHKLQPFVYMQVGQWARWRIDICNTLTLVISL